MKMIEVKCQGQKDEKCDNAYEGCKKRIMYSEAERKVICKDGEITVSE